MPVPGKAVIGTGFQQMTMRYQKLGASSRFRFRARCSKSGEEQDAREMEAIIPLRSRDTGLFAPMPRGVRHDGKPRTDAPDMLKRTAVAALPLLLLAACQGDDSAPGATSASEEQGLNDAAAMLDANSVDANA